MPYTKYTAESYSGTKVSEGLVEISLSAKEMIDRVIDIELKKGTLCIADIIKIYKPDSDKVAFTLRSRKCNH